jgi:UDP-GlcNAc:undecaprenyl-phosphate GlcNAc-1-phosphate transferase
MLTALVLLVISFGGALALTPFVRQLAVYLGAVDRPGERKIHTGLIPRLGGVSVVLSAIIAVLAGYAIKWAIGGEGQLDLEPWFPILAGGALVLLVGVWDDLRPVHPVVKFLFQASAAGVAMWFGVRIERASLFGGGPVELGVLALPITFLWIVGLTNAFNLVDGLDGLAAGLASIAAGTSAVIFLLRGDTHDAMLLLILLGALLGFLRYNFNPATIFLGDSGSLFVGYVLAVTAITGSQKGATTMAVVIPLLVFGLPIADTLLSMIRRFIGGVRVVQPEKAALKEKIRGAKRMFQADQRHIHHRLVDLGFSHRHAVLLLYSLGFGLSCLALMSVLAQYRNLGIILIVIGLATYIGIHKLGYEEIKFLRSGTLLRWYEQLAFNRHFFLGFADILLISTGYWMAFVLKYGLDWSAELVGWYADVFPLVLMTQLGVFAIFGLYRGVWRAMGIGDLIRIALAVGAAFALSFSAAVVSRPPDGALSFFCINFFVLGALVMGSRSIYRILDYVQQREGTIAGTALIYGAGRGGQLVLKELLQNSGVGLRPLGFVDDDPNLKGRTLNRVPVLGASSDLTRIMDLYPVSALVISSDKIDGERLERMISLCREREVSVLRGRVRIEPLDVDGITLSYATSRRAERTPNVVALSKEAPDWIPAERRAGGEAPVPILEKSITKAATERTA